MVDRFDRKAQSALSEESREDYAQYTSSDPSESNASSNHIELWPLDKLVPYEKNPRKNDSSVDRMCASIKEFGFKIPCLARGNGEVVDGHLRIKAARRLG